MPTIAPSVMDAKSFKRETTPANIFKRHRGKLLCKIDHAIDDWKGGNCLPKDKVPVLSKVVHACGAWIHAKSHKETPTAELRRATVQKLGEQAFARLQFELFEERKANSHYLGSMQPLQGGYANERASYAASGKTVAKSGSTAQTLVHNAPSIVGANAMLNGKTFNQLTRQEFEQLVDTYAKDMGFASEVLFFSKTDRISRMVVIEDGKMYDGPNHPLHTGDLDAGGWPYAIDEYGNLFTADHNQMADTLGNEKRFNHSSLNAGKDVICAGILQCVNGQPWCIDNNSGHYKPDAIQMRNALMMLQECGVDLDKLRVGIKEPLPGHPGKCVFKYYYSAATYLNHPHMRPNEVDVEK